MCCPFARTAHDGERFGANVGGQALRQTVLMSNVFLLSTHLYPQIHPLTPLVLPKHSRSPQLRPALARGASFGVIRWSLDKPQLGSPPRYPRYWRDWPFRIDKADLLQDGPNLRAQQVAHAHGRDVLRQELYGLRTLPFPALVSTLPAALAAKLWHPPLRIDLHSVAAPLAPQRLGTGGARRHVRRPSALVARKWHIQVASIVSDECRDENRCRRLLRHLALGTWHLALGTWHLALGTWRSAQLPSCTMGNSGTWRLEVSGSCTASG
jgi:hypothetical protein